MAKRTLPLSKVYGLLEPGPVTLVTTMHKGVANIMTMSWHTMMEFEPPLVGCVISNRNHSFRALKSTKECVINIPAAHLLDAVIGCGNTSGKDTDKFDCFGLTATPATLVSPPLLEQCFASLECRIADGKLGNSYNFFILEVLQAWMDPAQKNAKTLHHKGNGIFMIAGETIKTRSRMK